jgi:hypothetical protein
MEGYMPLLTIKKSSFEELPPGAYKAAFKSITPTETSKGEAYRWLFEVFEGDQKGKTISDLSDRKITTANKTGRWAAALAGKSPADESQINPDDYAGKKYLVILEGRNGHSKIATFTPLTV